MADTGKPLPFTIRQEIKERRQRETVREVAQSLRISKTTVQKYGRNRGTRLLQQDEDGE